MGLFNKKNKKRAKNLLDVAKDNLDTTEEERNETAMRTFSSQERISQASEYTDSNEEIHGVLQISGIGYGEDDDSILGENQGGGFKSSNEVAIFTNRRVIVRLPGFVKTDTTSIKYADIQSVETKGGVLKRKLILRTSGEGYHLAVSDSERVIKIAAKLVESKTREDVSSDIRRMEKTPIEKLEDLKRLYDNGTISEEEFETKKSELLDKI